MQGPRDVAARPDRRLDVGRYRRCEGQSDERKRLEHDAGFPFEVRIWHSGSNASSGCTRHQEPLRVQWICRQATLSEQQ
jgi:hypothetical protein